MSFQSLDLNSVFFLQKIINPYWLAGFVSAEGSFVINILNSKKKLGKQVVLMFTISQHSRDAYLLRSFFNLLDCGKYYASSTRNEGNFSVTKFFDLEHKIIPFFELYSLQGVKCLNFRDLEVFFFINLERFI